MGWCHFHDCEYMFVFFSYVLSRFIWTSSTTFPNRTQIERDIDVRNVITYTKIYVATNIKRRISFHCFAVALIILPVDHFSFLETDIPTISSHLPYASSKNQSTIESEMGKKKRYPIYENLNSNDPCDLFELVWAFSSSFYLVQPFLLSNFQHFLHSSNFFLVLMLPHLLFGSHKLSQNSQACDTIKCGELNSLPAIS